MLLFLFFLMTLFGKGHAEIEDLGDTRFEELAAGPLFVSLGSHCRPAHTLRDCGLRKMAFPFDWIVSLDGEALIEMLDEDFSHFFHLPSFFPFGPAGHLFQSYYHLEFLHEGDFNGDFFLSNFEKLVAKYTRRIERFRALNSYRGRVFFIREAYEASLTDPHRHYKCAENIEIREEYALRLYEALERRFPDLDFCLLIINHHAAGHVLIEKKLSPRLFMVRASPSQESRDRQARIAAYTQFFYTLPLPAALSETILQDKKDE